MMSHKGETDKLLAAVPQAGNSSLQGHLPNKVIPEVEDPQELPGKATNFNAVWKLIAGYREGYSLLGGAIPTTILRAFFYLLICFEVASVLEISIVPKEDRAEQIFIVAAVYTALIIIKTIFEALGRLFIALYGHGFCSYMRSTMFRKTNSLNYPRTDLLRRRVLPPAGLAECLRDLWLFLLRPPPAAACLRERRLFLAPTFLDLLRLLDGDLDERDLLRRLRELDLDVERLIVYGQN
ncbi:unnamed protein product [Heligmosomoides polygyrus]|uniref:Ion_trans domain-containing protein n=1 Tax=Heligmosomoides polygyrus TaxID=6339 RepID=A0A3P8FZ51_HELPZ|nr:unnamed protein product [Heligmosomoides polygyrus]